MKQEPRKLRSSGICELDDSENLKAILNYFKEDYFGEYSDERLHPLKVEFSLCIFKKLE